MIDSLRRRMRTARRIAGRPTPVGVGRAHRDRPRRLTPVACIVSLGCLALALGCARPTPTDESPPPHEESHEESREGAHEEAAPASSEEQATSPPAPARATPTTSSPTGEPQAERGGDAHIEREPRASGPTRGPSESDASEDDSRDGTRSEAEEEEKKKDEEAREQEEEKKRARDRRRVLLRTVYDDRDVGEEQTRIVEAELGLFRDEELESYVRSVAVRLLRGAPPQPFDYEFKIVDQQVPNAFALPGGKIYVSRGLLALVNTEAELAGVLGHEITHAAERHAAARVEMSSRINPLAIGLMRAATIAAYGRDQERDADRGGQILAAKAGYDPNAIATFLRKLDATERYEIGWSRLPFFLATHPRSPERSALANQRATRLEWTPVPIVASDHPLGYLGKINGLVIGDDPAGGLFQGGRFVHPELGFSLRFPPGWETMNTPQAVIAVSPARDAQASLTVEGEAGDLDRVIDDFIEREVDDIKVRIRERRKIKVGELPGIRVEGRARGLHFQMVFLDYDGLAYRLTMLTLTGSEARYRGRAHAFTQSFRPLDEAGRHSLEVIRVRVARALADETLQQLSVRTQNDLELVFTGVLNDLFPSTRLKRGQPVKIGLAEPFIPEPPEKKKEEAEDAAGSGDARSTETKLDSAR